MDLAEIDKDIAGAVERWDENRQNPDYHRLVHVARQLRAYIASIHGPDTDDPMPVFVLKAQDRLAIKAVNAYQDACETAGRLDQARQVMRAADEIVAWQERHQDLVKFPDHEHVPVGEALQTPPYCCELHSGPR